MSNKGSNTTQYNKRAPIVTIMGHVDHGKTSILDAIRKTNVQAREHGGITQHIGAYQIEHKSQKITFLDTPGHAAFTQMRMRGGKAADIVIIVVAAEESVKPQTKEAINLALAANVPIIIAVNKIDHPSANIKKVKQDLATEGVLVEDFGGEVVCVEVSAKTGQGLEKLLDAILAVSELINLKSSANGELEGIIIESRMDRKKGAVVSCIVKNGTLKVGDKITASGIDCVVKSVLGADGTPIKSASLSEPAEILGFKQLPSIGDLILDKGSELAALSLNEDKVEIVGKNTKKVVTIIVRADTQGTLEAIKQSLASIVTSSVGSTFSLKFLLCATGDVTDSDVMLAHSAGGIIVGFNVKISAAVSDLAESYRVKVKGYKTIYELIDDVKDVLIGTANEAELKIKGRARVLKIFKLPSGDIVAGSKVLAGALKEDSKVNIYEKDPADLTRDDMPLFSGNIKKLKRGKEDVTVVGKDVDCGVLLKPQFEDIKDNYWIEVI